MKTYSIHNFRPRWIDRCLYRRKYLFQRIALTIGSLFLIFLLWYSLTAAKRHHDALSVEQARTAKAESDRQEVLDVLSGKMAMVEPSGHYARIATVVWETVNQESKK